MEEKKTKTVNMRASQGEQEQKLTYEQLNDACQQLFQQNQYLVKELKEANMTNVFKRLDYLFRVLESAPSFDNTFVKQCASEIQEALTLKEENNKKEES